VRSEDPEYVQELGRAVYRFARCEWCAVYCVDKLLQIEPRLWDVLSKGRNRTGSDALGHSEIVESGSKVPDHARNSRTESPRKGYVETIMSTKPTSGRIAGDLQQLAKGFEDAALKAARKEELTDAAECFDKLVKERNDLVHAKPCADKNREPRLDGSRHGIWTREDIQCFAERVSSCARALRTISEILGDRLKQLS